MNALTGSSLSMPLVAKDLAQMSGRIGTYRLRFCVGAFLVVPALFVIAFGGFGNGAALGSTLAGLEFTLLNVAVYALLPMMAADAIASEKQAATLPLLMLANMTPAGVVLQKYLSRLVPMATLILLSAPVVAVSYAYGGSSISQLADMFLILALTSVQVAAMGIFASALCRTTTGAIVAAYVTGLIFYFGPYALAQLDHASVGILQRVTGLDLASERNRHILMSWVPFTSLTDPGVPRALPVVSILLSTVVFLLLSERLVSRSMRAPSIVARQKFRTLDALFVRMDALLGRTRLGRDPNALPYDKPVAWRGMNRLGLMRRHHLVRFMLLVEAPAVIVLSLMALFNAPPEAWTMVAGLTWAVCGLVLLNQSTSALSRERTDQTMEILLTTPIDAAELVSQHYAVLKRLLLALMFPCVTVFFPLFFLAREAEWPLAIFASILMAMRNVVLLGLVASARYRNRFVALAVTLVSVIGMSMLWTVAIGIWVAIPWLGVICVPVFILLMRSGRDRQLSHATYALTQSQLASAHYARWD